MPSPSLTTNWPTGDDLRRWWSDHGATMQVDTQILDEVFADASATIFQQLDPEKMPTDPEECPRSVARAIVLEAARLLFRAQSPHGVAAFGEVAIRLRTADVDVERMIEPYTLGAMP